MKAGGRGCVRGRCLVDMIDCSFEVSDGAFVRICGPHTVERICLYMECITLVMYSTQ